MGDFQGNASIEQVVLKVCHGTFELRGQAWGPKDAESGKRILCWPGWLDNSGSFETLGPFFAREGYRVVAMDPPGCGFSQHREQCSWYNDYDEAPMIIQVADSLGWTEPFIMMGHSRGSNLGSLLSGPFSYRVRATVCYDGSLGPYGCYSANREETGPLMGKFSDIYAGDHKNRKRKPRVFKSREEAHEHNRTNPTFPKDIKTARAIANRHLTQLPDGRFTFTHDVRTYGQVQPHAIMPPGNIEFLKSIRNPVLMLAASSSAILIRYDLDTIVARFKAFSDFYNRENLRGYQEDLIQRIDVVPKLTIKVAEGLHHVHSDDPDQCALMVINWFKEVVDRTPHEGTIPPDLRTPFFARFKEIMATIPDFAVPDLGKLEYREHTPKNARVKELKLDILGRKIAVRLWGNPNSPEKVICCCDHFDNAASFDILCSLIAEHFPDDVCMAAIDLPGRGKSDWLPRSSVYDPCEDAFWLMWIAESLEFDEPFSIISHGTGATPALIAAGGLPQRVKALVLLDHICASSLPDHSLPSEMAWFYEEDKKFTPEVAREFSQKRYHTFAEFVQAQEQIHFCKRSNRANSLIYSRKANFDPVSNSYTLAEDPRLVHVQRVTVPINYESIVRSIKNVKAPVLTIYSSDSSRANLLLKEMPPPFQRCLIEMAHLRSNRTVVHVKSSHYMHIDDSIHTAQVVSEWLSNNKIWPSVPIPGARQDYTSANVNNTQVRLSSNL